MTLRKNSSIAKTAEKIPFHFTPVPHAHMGMKKLDLKCRALYGVLYSLSAKKGSCKVGRRWLTDLLGLSISSITRAISTLQEGNWIRVTSQGKAQTFTINHVKLQQVLDQSDASTASDSTGDHNKHIKESMDTYIGENKNEEGDLTRYVEELSDLGFGTSERGKQILDPAIEIRKFLNSGGTLRDLDYHLESAQRGTIRNKGAFIGRMMGDIVPAPESKYSDTYTDDHRPGKYSSTTF